MAIKKSKRFECGCLIYTPVAGIDDYAIVYCPKHAAAPEMYEALRDLIQEIEDFGDAGWYDEVNVFGKGKFVTRSKAALAKAEGNDDTRN